MLSVAGSPCWVRRSPSHAAGTPAGTNIQNTAQVSYTVGGSTVTATSNTSSVTVAEIVDAVLTIANATVPGRPGATAEELVFTLTNTGNGTETFNLTALSAGIVGDDFDPDARRARDLLRHATTAATFPAATSPTTPARTIRCWPPTRVSASSSSTTSRTRAVNGNRGRSQLTARVADRHRRARHDLRRSRRRRRRRRGRHDRRRRRVVRRVPGRGRAAHRRQVADDRRSVRRRGDALPGARINYQIVVTPSGTRHGCGDRFQRSHSREHHLRRRLAAS